MAFALLYISLFIPLLPALIGVVRYRKLEAAQRWLLLLVVLVACNQLLARYLTIRILDNNMPFMHLYLAIECLLLLRIFALLLPPLVPVRWLARIAGVFSIAWLVNVAWPSMLWEYPSLLRFAEGLLILGLTGAYLYKVFDEQEIVHLEREFSFWFVLGLVVFFASNLMLYLFSELVVEQDHEVFKSIWLVHAALAILLYISFSVALICRKPAVIS